MNYAKLIDENTLEYAPKTVTIGQTHYNPTPQSWLSENGYLPVADTPMPEYEEGYIWVSHWEVQNNQIVRAWEKQTESAEPTIDERVSDLEGAVEILLSGETDE